jgi:hypothetical protein
LLNVAFLQFVRDYEDRYGRNYKPQGTHVKVNHKEIYANIYKLLDLKLRIHLEPESTRLFVSLDAAQRIHFDKATKKLGLVTKVVPREGTAGDLQVSRAC